MHQNSGKGSNTIYNIFSKCNIALFLIPVMLIGFLVSRAMLSISVFLFGINALRNVPLSEWFKQKWWLYGMLWVIGGYALSGFWSADKETWGTLLQLKLPVMLLPLAIMFLPPFNPKQVVQMLMAMSLLLLFGCGYSIYFLITDFKHVMTEYKIAHLLPTLAKSEYISYSLMVALFIVLLYACKSYFTTRFLRIFFLSMGIIFALYLHILAAKSGLVALYVFFMVQGFHFLLVKKSKIGLAVILAIPVIVVAGICFLPTMGERKNYIEYTLTMYKQKDKTGKFGDLSRLMSYQIATEIIGAHPLSGVGTGDMLAEMKKGYDKYYPEVADGNRLIPHNQFLTVALGCGIPIMLLFGIWVYLPLTYFKRSPYRTQFIATWLVLFIELMVEPYLEGQFGMFVYLFYTIIYFLLPKQSESVA